MPSTDSVESTGHFRQYVYLKAIANAVSPDETASPGEPRGPGLEPIRFSTRVRASRRIWGLPRPTEDKDVDKQADQSQDNQAPQTPAAFIFNSPLIPHE